MQKCILGPDDFITQDLCVLKQIKSIQLQYLEMMQLQGFWRRIPLVTPMTFDFYPKQYHVSHQCDISKTEG